MSDDSAEQWRPVLDWEGLYGASSLGRVRSLPRMTATGRRGGCVLKPKILNGYPWVCLTAPGRREHRSVHQLVCEAFHGPRPDGLEVRHLDGNPQNSLPGNLKWGTRSENMQDRILHGTDPQVNKTHCPVGHEYTEDNIYWLGPDKSRRGCKTCARARSRAQHPTHKDGDGPAYVHWNSEKTHCPKGHPYSGENLIVDSRGDRICRECKLGNQRRRRQRLRESAA